MSDSSQPKDSWKTLTIDGRSLDDIIKDCTIDLSGTGASMNDVTIISSGLTYDYNSISTITLGSGITTNNGAGTYTLSNDTITLTGIDSSAFTFNLPEEWKDCFPPWGRVSDMCKQYPALEIALRNFKVVYDLVKDDYDNPIPKK